MTTTPKLALGAALMTAALALPGFAQDAEKGAKDFAKCKACHMIVAADGTEIQKGGKTGPNLWGIVGREIGSVEGFAYGTGLAALAGTGQVWDEPTLVEYMKDPAKWVKDATGDAGAKSKMTFKLARGGEDVAAYLATVSPEAEAAAAPATN